MYENPDTPYPTNHIINTHRGILFLDKNGDLYLSNRSHSPVILSKLKCDHKNIISIYACYISHAYKPSDYFFINNANELYQFEITKCSYEIKTTYICHIPCNTKFITSTCILKNPLCFLTSNGDCLFLEQRDNKYSISSPLLKNIKEIAFNRKKVVYLTSENELYYVKLYSLPFSDILIYVEKKPIKKLSIGDKLCAILTSDNDAYTWGSDHDNFGYLTRNGKKISSITKKNIMNIYTGDYEIFYVNKYNLVYACGRNLTGQLGVGNFENQHKPKLINLPRNIKIVTIKCSNSQTFFITDNGCVYACGFNESHDPLGVNTLGNKNTPTLIPNLQLFTQSKNKLGDKLFKRLTKEKYRNLSDLLIKVE